MWREQGWTGKLRLKVDFRRLPTPAYLRRICRVFRPPCFVNRPWNPASHTISSLSYSQVLLAKRAAPHLTSSPARKPTIHHVSHRTGLQTAFSSPSLCASRLRASSLSPIARTKPDSAYTWFSPGTALPLSSTLAIEICTDAWSLALMMRFVALHLRGT